MNQPKKKSRMKPSTSFFIIIALCALLGAVGSIIVQLNTLSLQNIFAFLNDALYHLGMPLMVASLVFPLIGTILIKKGYRLIPAAQQDDAAYEQANQTLCAALIFSQVGSIWSISVMGLSFCTTAFGLNYGIFVSLFALILQLIWNTWLQVKSVNGTKQLNPEKQGDVLDVKFQRDWYNSCDEAERSRIGECSHFSFRIMSNVYPFLLVIMVFANMVTPLHALLFVAVGGLWAVQSLTYLIRAYQLEHKR